MAITKIQIDNTFLTKDADYSTLAAAVAAASGTLTVVSINKFAVNKILLIGEVGSEKSEIIKTHAATAPTGSTVTLASNTVYAHPAGTKVYIIDYDRYELSNAPTATGSKTLLTTALGSGLLAIDAEATETLYSDTEYTSGYYFVRRKETVGNTFSGYSDPIPQSGFAADTVGYMIDAALSELSLSLSDKVTAQNCFRWLNKGMREIKGKLRNWTENYVYDYVAGQTARGINAVTLPTNIYDAETNRSIEGVRIGTDGELQYVEPGRFEAQKNDAVLSTVRTEALAADTSLAIVNSYDLADSGSVNVYVGGTRYTISYTGVTRSATVGVLTGIPASGDGSITITLPVGTNVWQGETEGVPEIYTVKEGTLYFWPLAASTSENKNIYLDYNTEVTEVNSVADTIDVHRYEMLESYLTWRIWCKAENDGKLDTRDGYYAEYKSLLNDAIRVLPSKRVAMAPNLNTMSRRGKGFRTRPDVRELANEDL